MISASKLHPTQRHRANKAESDGICCIQQSSEVITALAWSCSWFEVHRGQCTTP